MEKELEEWQKQKQKQKQKKYHYKLLDNFKKELIKKLYQDLFKLNRDLFINENITYEFFLFQYYATIDQHIDFNKPDYPGLVSELNEIIKKKTLANKQNKELNEEIEDLYKNAEWELIHKYKSSLEMEKLLDEKKIKKEKMKKYNDELTAQIELNKKLKKKNIKEEQNLEKQDQYLLDENLARKELQEIRIKQGQEKEEEQNYNINDNDNDNANDILDMNKSSKEEENIDFKLLSEKDRDEMITAMVDKIMKEKRAQKIDNILNGLKSKYNIEEKNYKMPEIKYEPKKIDEILYKEMLKYQDI
jgi:hypothetical protein